MSNVISLFGLKNKGAMFLNYYMNKNLNFSNYIIKLQKSVKKGKINFWIVVSDLNKPKLIYSKLGYYKSVGVRKICFLYLDQLVYWITMNAKVSYKVAKLLFFIFGFDNYKANLLIKLFNIKNNSIIILDRLDRINWKFTFYIFKYLKYYEEYLKNNEYLSFEEFLNFFKQKK